jgi:hypothetical protein
MPTGFGDDLNASLDQPTLAFTGFQAPERHACQFAADKLDGLYDVSERRAIADGAGIRTLATPRPRSARAEPDASCAGS